MDRQLQGASMLKIAFTILLFACLINCGNFEASASADHQGWDTESARAPASASGQSESTTGNLTSKNFLAHLVVKPSFFNGFAEQSLASVRLSSENPEQSSYQKTHQLYGSCKFSALNDLENTSSATEQDSDKIAIWGDITVSLNAEDVHEFQQFHNNTINTKCDGSSYFSVELLASKAYRLILNPAGAHKLPPAYFDLKLTEDSSKEFDLKMPKQEVKGKIILPERIQTDAFYKPKFAITLTQNEMLVSNKALVEPSEDFSLWLSNPLPHNIAQHPIIMEMHPVDAQSPYPSIRKEIKPNSADISPIISRGYESLSALVLWNMQLKTTQNSNTEQLPTQVFLRHTEFSNIEKVFLTDEAGFLSAELPAGTYELFALPDPMANLEAFFGTFKLDPNNVQNEEPVFITLETSSPSKIKIIDAAGAPIVSAQIKATLFKAHDEQISNFLGKLRPSNQFTTDSDGKVCTLTNPQEQTGCKPPHLIPGIYDIQIRPAPGSKLFFMNTRLEVDASSLAIQFPQAFRYRGKLAAQRNKPIPDAFVQIYDPVREQNSKNFNQLAEAYTDQNGIFEVYLPLQTLASE